MDLHNNSVATRFIAELRDLVNRLEFHPRDIHTFPLDSIITEILSKAFGLAEACVLLCESERPDEAYGLSRSLVECTAILRYLTSDGEQKESRVRGFIGSEHAERAYWLSQSRQYVHDPELLRQIEDFAKAEELDSKAVDPRLATQHWSGVRAFVWKVMTSDHPLDHGNSLEFHKKAYAVDYHATSHYVHCSPRGLSNYFQEPGAAFVVSKSSLDFDDTATKMPFLVVTYLSEIVRYSLFGLNLDAPGEIDLLFSRALGDLRQISM